MSKIIASIVLYGNEISILKQAIDSFLNTDLDITLILIDNSPSDLLRILQFDNRINYIHNPSNPGFGSSHNIALQKSLDLNADYHLVLNPDIYFSSGTLENIVDFMNENKNIGHLMPKILYPNGEFQFLCKKNPTFFDLFIRGFLPSFLKNKFAFRLNNYLYKFANFNDIIFDVPYLSGCFMFFRISTLKKVGFFDEKIFMYLEDADITRRFLEFSNTVYYPFATVFHHYAGLTHKKLKFKIITIQSAFIYFNKWGWFKNIF